MEPYVVALVDRLLDAIAPRRFELIGDFASAIPIEVIGTCSHCHRRRAVALDQPASHVALDAAAAALRDRARRSAEKFPADLARGRPRQNRLQRDGSPADQSRTVDVVGTFKQVADHLDRNRGGEIADQLEIAFGRDRVEQPVHQCDYIGFHLGDRARRQRAHDQPPHAGMAADRETRLVVWCS